MKRMILILLFALASCQSLPVVEVPSANQNSRVGQLVIHFTSEHFAESLRLLTERTEAPVSSHYLVPEPGDETYSDNQLQIYRLVAEERRAWHAGRSYWAGSEALNDSSVGIEIVNRSGCVDLDPSIEVPVPENQSCRFFAFSEEQLQLVVRLIEDILARHPGIDPVDVIGHADIAPGRRVDPGPLFPWKKLHDLGIGAWYDNEPVQKFRDEFQQQMPSIDVLQKALRTFGYKIEHTGENDPQTRFVVRAFQMHFRPENYTGQMDAETAAILFALNQKYRVATPAM